MPSHLDDVAQAEWRRFAPILRSMGILTQADGPVLAIYCSAYSRWVKAEEEIAKAIAADASNPLAGLTVSQATGSSKVGPMVTISKHAQATMLKILTEFGCTPSSRSKVKVTQVKRDDLDDFIEAPKKKAR